MLKSAIDDSNNLLRKHDPSKLITPLFYTDECFVLNDGYIGAGFICEPLSGCDESTVQKLEALYSQDYQEGTFVQVALYGLGDIDQQLNRFELLRHKKAHPSRQGIFDQDTKMRMEYLRRFTNEPINKTTGLRIRNFQVIVSFKMPAKAQPPSDLDFHECQVMSRNVYEVLKGVGLRPKRMVADSWLHTMRTLFNWRLDATWRHSKTTANPKVPLNEQVFDWGKTLRIDNTGVQLENKSARVLSIQKWPDFVSLPQMFNLIGDWRTGNYGVRDNMAIILNIFYPDQDKALGKVDTKRQTVNYQAYGPLLKWVPTLQRQKESHDALYESITKGGRITKSHLHFVLFSDSPQELDSAIASMKTYYRSLQMHIQEETWAQLPMLMKALPFGQDVKAVDFTKRYQTLTSYELSEISPILSDWKGTGSPILNFVSRNGQFMNIDLFDSLTNYNATVAAKSGSGKSFLVNEMIMAYLSSSGPGGEKGGRTWVIDVGRSYEKLSEALNGKFICFDDNADFSLNPFPNVTDETWNDQSDQLLAWINAMASPGGHIDDVQLSSISQYLTRMWHQEKQALTITKIADAMKLDDDPRISDIGKQLYPFTEQGPYGHFFSDKKPPVEFDNDFIVLELEELKGRKHLQQVVLLQLIGQIQNEMYLGVRDRRKLLIIDEAWDLLTGGAVTKFVESGYRRFRKYSGAALTITQSVNDLYDNESGRAIAENSSSMFLLSQKSETLDSLKASKRLSFPDGIYEVLKTVHTIPGQYSEIFFYTELGAGVGRLYVNRFRQLLFSTKAEEVHAIKIYQDQGLSIEDAIEKVIADEGGEL